MGCNYDVGECWLPGEETSGAGGGIINPTGAGGFGSVPLRPQGIDGESYDLCASQTVTCTVTWKADSSVCQGRGSAGSCTTLYQGQHTSLDEAEVRCEFASGVRTGSGAQSCSSCEWGTGSAGDSCRKICEERAEACEADCRKIPVEDKPSRRRCWERCNNVYAECIRKCKG